MIHHLALPKLINKMLEIMYVFKLIFINVYTLVLRVIHGSFSTSLGAFSWIQLANSFHSNHPPYMSYENHDLYKFVHVKYNHKTCHIELQTESICHGLHIAHI